MTFDPSTLVYNAAGLIPAIAQDSQSKDVLMMAWMNEEAVNKTLETGKATYWSRSRNAFGSKAKLQVILKMWLISVWIVTATVFC